MAARHREIARLLRSEISQGARRPGTKLPPELTLARTHGVSRGTIRRALATLTAEGLISTVQGSGSYVTSTTPMSRFFSLSSFDADVRAAGLEPSTKVLFAEVVPASQVAAARLGNVPGAPLIVIRRLRLVDGHPAAVEERILAASLCPALLDEDLEHQSLHWLLAVKYAIPLVRIEHVVERRTATAREADELGIASGDPVMGIDRLTFTEGRDGPVPAVWFTAAHVEERIPT